jgi:hypothetical protein
MNPSGDKGKFVIATPGRSVCDDNARALEKDGALRFLALGTRRGAAKIAARVRTCQFYRCKNTFAVSRRIVSIAITPLV